MCPVRTLLRFITLTRFFISDQRVATARTYPQGWYLLVLDKTTYDFYFDIFHRFAGIPHILEHCTLCGSNQFPVRDPFMKMLNRSVATMNAMTGPDYTLYPFATPNSKDFYNLMQVRLTSIELATLIPSGKAYCSSISVNNALCSRMHIF